MPPDHENLEVNQRKVTYTFQMTLTINVRDQNDV
jgi:hypothetical protein